MLYKTTTAAFLALAVVILGCNKPEAPPAATSSSPSVTRAIPASSDKGIGTQIAGPFSVTLTTDPSTPKPGKVSFTADISKNGGPVATAKVSLDLYMPSMKMQGPNVEMKPDGAGKYTAEADVMASDYEAKVSVSDGTGKGKATFKFQVK